MPLRSPTAVVGTLFSEVSRLLRGNRSPSAALLPYILQVRPSAELAERSYHAWLTRIQDLPDSQVLANAASVQRWEVASMAEALASIVPPREVFRLHHQLIDAMRDFARAFQLLSAGYRATTYATVCDGQALLTEAHTSLRLIAEQLSRWSQRIGLVPAAITRAEPPEGQERQAG